MTDDVSVQFGAQTDQFSQGVKNAMRPVADFSQRIKELNAELTALDNPVKNVAAAADHASKSTDKLSFATAGATREFIVIGHEIVSGNFSRIPGSMMVLGERMSGLHTIVEKITPATIAWGAAIGGVIAVTYEWIAASEHLAEVQNTIRGAMELNNQSLSYNADNVAQNITRLRLFADVGKDTAEQIAIAFARAGSLSEDLRQKLIQMVGDYAAATGKEAPKAAEELIRMFSDPARGAKELAAVFTGILSPAQIDEIELLAKNGDALKIQGTLYDALGAKIDGFRENHLTPLQREWEKTTNAFIKFFNHSQLKPGQSWTDKGPLKLPAEQAAGAKQQDRQNELNRAIMAGYKIEEQSGLLVSRKNALLERQVALRKAAQAAEEQGDAKTAARFRNDANEIQQQINSLKGKGQKESESAAKKTLDERLAVQRSVTATEVQIEKIGLQAKRDMLNEEVAAKRITVQQKFALLEEYERQEYNAGYRALLKESQQEGLSVLQKQQVYDRIKVLYAQHQADMAKISSQGAKEQAKRFDQVFQTINRSFQSSITGILQGTQTWRQAMGNIFTNLASSFAGMLEEMAMKWLETQIMNALIGKAEATATIAAHAAAAGAAAWASTAAIPIIGPELAPAAAAAAYSGAMSFAAIPSFDVGSWDVPQDTMAMVHQGEMIVPRTFADDMRGGGNLGGGGGDTHLHVHAIDGASVKKLFMEHGSTLAAALSKQTRNFNPNTPWKAA